MPPINRWVVLDKNRFIASTYSAEAEPELKTMPTDKKAQVSMEYLSIIGFVVIIVSILIVISTVYSRQVNDQILLNQADRLAKDIVDSAEKVYYWGPPSRITLKSYIPAGIQSIQIISNEVVFTVRTQNGLSDISYKAPVNITGYINNSEGLRNIRIESQTNFVYINGSIS